MRFGESLVDIHVMMIESGLLLVRLGEMLDGEERRSRGYSLVAVSLVIAVSRSGRS